MSKFQIGVNDDRELYVWRETWKDDTIRDFLTRLAASTQPRLNRSAIHLSFDGVRLGETTSMRETGLADEDEVSLHHGSGTCKQCTGSRKGPL